MTDPVPGFRLEHELDGTSYAVRENLVDILERELLGPVGGPDELLPVSPRQIYLVGHIAPVKLAEGRIDLAAVEDGDGLAEVRGDVEGPHIQQGLPALADESGADSDEDDVDDKAPKQGLMIPASMGLRFQVPDDLSEFTVTASWGTYESVTTGEVDKKGRKVRRYRRTPVGVTVPLKLAALVPGKTHTEPLSRQV